MNDQNTIRPGDDIISAGSDNATIRLSGNDIQSATTTAQAPAPSLGAGPVSVNGKVYEQLQHIASMGEAEVYKGLHQNKWYVLKYYYNNFTPSDEIVEKLKGFSHPDIIKLIDTSVINHRYIEVQEFAAGGSLADQLPERDEQQLLLIVKEVVEALHQCHKNNIIHRDIKPGNIFYRKPGKEDVAIGDFGIASPLKSGEALKLTRRFLTQSYAAPEMLTGLTAQAFIGKEVDYYALGITLIHLWSGNDPFGMLPDYEATRCKLDGRIPIPDDFPPRLLILVKGLLTIEPSRRWGYKEVSDWLQGKNVQVFFETAGTNFSKFSFGRPDGKALHADNPIELAALMEKHSDLGKRHLYKHTISQWLKDSDPGLYIEVQKLVEEDFPNDVDAGFIKALYLLDPNKPYTDPQGNQHRTQQEMAQLFLSDTDFYQKELKNPLAAFYMFLEARGYQRQAGQFRDLFTKRNPLSALHFIILSLLNQTWVNFDGITLHHPSDIFNQSKANQKKLITGLKSPNSLLSVWAESFEDVAPKIEKWRGLKNPDEDFLSVSLGRGLPLDGQLLQNQDDLLELLSQKPEILFDKKLDDKLAEKLDLWLTTFEDSSFMKATIALFFGKKPKTNLLIVIWDYLLRNALISGFDYIDMMRKSIPLIIVQYPGRIDDLADILEGPLEKYLSDVPRGIRFHDRMKRLLDLHEELKKEPEHALLLQKALLLLDAKDVIADGFAGDLKKDAGDEQKHQATLKKRKDLMVDLEKLGLNASGRRVVAEERMLKSLERGLEKDFKKEKRDKEKLVKMSFKSVTSLRKRSKAEMSQQQFYRNIGISLATGLLSGGLMFATTFIDPLVFAKWMGYLVGGIFVLAALALLSSFLEDGCLIALGLAALAGVIGYKVGANFKLEYLQYILGGIGVLGIGWFLFSVLKRKFSLAGSHLSDTEKATLKDNLQRTEEYYSNKLSSELEYHSMHCATLSWKEFEKEYGKYLK